MKNRILKSILLSGAVVAAPSYAQIDVSSYDIAAAGPKTPAVLVMGDDQGAISDDEAEYILNNVNFVPDISNNCEDQAGKCKYYVVPNVYGKVFNSESTNITMMKSEGKFEAINDIYDTYEMILRVSDSERLLQIIDKLRTIEFKIKFETNPDNILALESQKTQLELEKSKLNAGLPQEVQDAFETQLRYSLPNVGISVSDEDTYQDLVNHLQDLRKQKVGQIFLYVDVGYPKSTVSAVAKVYKLLKQKNSNAQIEYIKTSKSIDVKMAYSDAGGLDTDAYGMIEFMKLKNNSKISPNGGTVVLDLDYDGVKEIERIAAHNGIMSFPLDFDMHYDWEFYADASVSCRYKQSFVSFAEQMATATGAEDGRMVVPAATIASPNKDKGILDCKDNMGKIISKELKAKMDKIAEDERKSLKQLRAQSIKEYSSWEKMVKSFSSLNGASILGAKKFETIRNFQQKCQVVSVGSSSSSFFGLVKSDNSRAQKICWEEYQDVIKEYYAPVEFNLVHKASYEKHINQEFSYNYKGYDTIKRTISPNFSFCTKLGLYSGTTNDVKGSNCSYKEQRLSITGN